jgi:hypothetical protein
VALHTSGKTRGKSSQIEPNRAKSSQIEPRLGSLSLLEPERLAYAASAEILIRGNDYRFYASDLFSPWSLNAGNEVFIKPFKSVFASLELLF